MYAWCLETIGGLSEADAGHEALDFYKYEDANKKFRDLVFHDEAWHWAMLKIFGDSYHLNFPEYELPSTAYRNESERYEGLAHE